MPSVSDRMAANAAETIYGSSRRRKLMPLESMAMISLLAASLEVKNITVMNTNSGLNMFRIYGMKLR